MKKSTPKKTVKTAKKAVKKSVKRPTPTTVAYNSSLSPFQILLWLSIIFSSILIIISKL